MLIFAETLLKLSSVDIKLLAFEDVFDLDVYCIVWLGENIQVYLPSAQLC